MSVVAHRAGEHPPGVHVGEVQRAGELSLQRGAAVGDGVALEEARFGLDIVTHGSPRLHADLREAAGR